MGEPAVKHSFVFKTQPYAHQLSALEVSCDREEFALFMEMGTGKSKVLIDNIAYLYGKGSINAVLIVAPKGVYNNWVEKELPQHLPDFITNKTVIWKAGSKKSEDAVQNLNEEYSFDLKILVMNVEAFSTKKGARLAYKFVSLHNALMAIDESTTIKNPTAKRTKNLITLGKYAKYRRILTGSPITKSPLDVYTQSQFLDPALLGYSSYYSFRAHFALLVDRQTGGRTFKQVVGFQNLTELTELLSKFSYRVLKEDCLDLPDKIYLRREIELTPEQKKIYKELREYAIANLNNAEVVTASSVLTQLLRLHQVSCGFVSQEDGELQELKNNRVSELMQILDETSGKVIIWANYQYDIERIYRAISEAHGPESVGTYYGATSDSDRKTLVADFQDPDSPVRYFVGNTQTGGYGLTLTAAHTVVYYSNSYDLEKRLQSEDRAHRIGQTSKVTYIDLFCKDTVDEKIVKALREKLDVAKQVLGEEQWKDWL